MSSVVVGVGLCRVEVGLGERRGLEGQEMAR